VVYRDVTRQAKGLYRLKHTGALGSGLAYLSRYNSGWFCHRGLPGHHAPLQPLAGPVSPKGVTEEGNAQRCGRGYLLALPGQQVLGGQPQGQHQEMGGGVVRGGEPSSWVSVSNELPACGRTTRINPASVR
jgi:hypothetical protein